MFEWITTTVRTLGYSGVVMLTLLEHVFPPIPSELVIPLAGVVAAQGNLNVWGVIAAGSAGSLAGATFWYEIGRRLGERRVRKWVARYGKWLTLTPEHVDRAEQWFQRRGGMAVLIGRLVPGVRTFVSLPAGFARMPLGRFLRTQQPAPSCGRLRSPTPASSSRRTTRRSAITWASPLSC